ncbi:MAG: trypsin-like serine protease, partial [Proteobacteria bacterium]
MRFQSKIFLTVASFALSCTPSPKSSTKMVGGFPIDGKNFHSSGRLLDSGECTVTRVGKRHFLTAGHCTKNVLDHLRIQSHKNSNNDTNKYDFRYNSYTFSEKVEVSGTPYFYDEEAMAQKITPDMKEGERDWGMVILDHKSNDPQTFADSNAWLEENFAIRKVGDPSSVKAGHTLMYAGFGTSKLSGNTLASCVPSVGATCFVTYAPTSTFDVENGGDKNYAFFKVDEAGTGLTPNFFSLASLSEVIVGDNFDYQFNEKDRGIPSDARGIAAPGDSGSSVLNSSQEIVAVLKGIVFTTTFPFALWSHFSSFDPAKVKELLETPLLDYAPNYVAKGQPFYVLGYKLQNFDYTDGGTVDPGAYQIDSECKSLGQDLVGKFQDANLVKGEDYECYKVGDEIPPSPFPISHGGRSVHTTALGGDDKYGVAYCTANITFYQSIDGVLSLASFPYTSAQGTFPLYDTNPETGEVSDVKNNPQALIQKQADEIGHSMIKRENLPRDWDWIWAESCDGGTSSGGGAVSEEEAVA